MEQKEVVHRFTSTLTTTIKNAVEAMAQLTGQELRQVMRETIARPNRKLGEQEYYAFMSDSTHKSVEELTADLSKPANLNKIRDYLNRRGVAFSFRKDKGKQLTELLFRTKDEKVIESALKDLLHDVTKDPEQFMQKAKDRPLGEQIATKQAQQKLQSKTFKKKPVMQKGR